MTLEIFYDDNHEGNWFKSLCISLSDVPLNKIRSRGQNPPYIENLLRYDRPDIILVEDEVPRLILEKTREVPTVVYYHSSIVKIEEGNIATYS